MSKENNNLSGLDGIVKKGEEIDGVTLVAKCIPKAPINYERLFWYDSGRPMVLYDFKEWCKKKVIEPIRYFLGFSPRYV